MQHPSHGPIPATGLKNCCSCLKGMKLRCLEAGGGDSYVLLDSTTGKDCTTEKQEELQFFNENGSFHAVVVERNLRVVDLCQILTVKNQVCKDFQWSIVEHWEGEEVERVLEDHEDILAVHRRTPTSGKKYIFCHISTKYDFFTNPRCFFPKDMMSYMKSYFSNIDQRELLKKSVWNLEETPMIFGPGNFQSHDNRSTWIKKFFVLKGTRILMSADAAVVKRFLRAFKRHFIKDYESLKSDADSAELEMAVGFTQRLESDIEAAGPSGELNGATCSESGHLPVSYLQSPVFSPESLSKNIENDEKKGKLFEGEPTEELEFLADLTEYEIYQCITPSELLGTPSAICLRHISEEDFRSCIYIGTGNKQDHQCWLAAMRLAKYGKQLRENYKSFMEKQETVSSHNDNMRSRVAMDFTGSVGRIVEDPQEIKEIERSEGVIWKKRWKEMVAHQQLRRGPTAPRDDQGAHLNQPWFHENMSRDQAVALLNSFPEKDGIFVVRDSRSKPGCYVLTSKHNGKVLHTTIEPLQVKDVEGVSDVSYTIDNGLTRFIDLYQLVWFLILNTSTLPSKLLHWSRH